MGPHGHRIVELFQLVIWSDDLLKTGLALTSVNQTSCSEGVQSVMKENMLSRALAIPSHTLSPLENQKLPESLMRNWGGRSGPCSVQAAV